MRNYGVFADYTYQYAFLEGPVIPFNLIKDAPRSLAISGQFGAHDHTTEATEADLLVTLFMALLEPVEEITANIRTFLLLPPQHKQTGTLKFHSNTIQCNLVDLSNAT